MHLQAFTGLSHVILVDFFPISFTNILAIFIFRFEVSKNL